MSKGYIIYCPYPSKDEAKRAARVAVEKNLAFCVNVFDCESVYVFDGEMGDHAEFVCFFKTLECRLDKLRAFIEESHPYAVPAIVTLEIKDINLKYLDWAKTELEC
jgi:periplasmic divalent cation tolerance protein